MPVTDKTFKALVDARCWAVRPCGDHPLVWRNAVAEQIRREQEALNWVPADPEMVRQCSTDGVLQVAA